MTDLAPRCVELISHPGSARPGIVQRIYVEISSAPDVGLCLRYFVDGDIRRIAVPPPAPAEAADGLWRHTCFEAFVAGQGSTAYCEFNFSPSGQWATYGFTRYREGMAPLGRALPPRLAVSVADDRLALEAVVPRETLLGLPGGPMLRLGLAAVIERGDGVLSHWALAHPGDRPDFHDPAGFVLEIDRDPPW
jgi:hypothetical protein